MNERISKEKYSIKKYASNRTVSNYKRILQITKKRRQNNRNVEQEAA